jgi:DNA-binding response OmpR family regulator
MNSEPRTPIVLLVEDDLLVRDAVLAFLTEEGLDVHAVEGGEEALASLGTHSLGLVLLDVGLPGISGFETLRRIRLASAVPVIMLTAASDVADRLEGFDLGADDYITKPVVLQELVRRVRAVLHRSHARRIEAAAPHLAPREELRGPGGVRVDTAAHAVTVGDIEVPLLGKQYELLCWLLEQRGRVATPDEVSMAVWGYPTDGAANYVEALISRVRGKLAAAGAPDVIRTVRGVGYAVTLDDGAGS